jgi:hypothetical protein
MAMPDDEVNSSGVENAENASDAEIERYEDAFRETRRVLDECIRNLMLMLDLEENSARRNDAARKLEALNGQRSDLVAANIAFHAGRVTMTPPSRALVTEISALSSSAVELISQRKTAAAILQLATNALSKFAAIQDIKDN